MNDKQKRDAAVDAFALAIKARLDEQAAKGYTGWDGLNPSSNVLRAEIVNDAAHDYRRETDEKVVDIGARAMMLHHRALLAPACHSPSCAVAVNGSDGQGGKEGK